jgi:hypothetical protein
MGWRWLLGPKWELWACCGGKEKGDGVGCWAGKKDREGLVLFLFFSFLFQPFTHKIFSGFQKLF